MWYSEQWHLNIVMIQPAMHSDGQFPTAIFHICVIWRHPHQSTSCGTSCGRDKTFVFFKSVTAVSELAVSAVFWLIYRHRKCRFTLVLLVFIYIFHLLFNLICCPYAIHVAAGPKQVSSIPDVANCIHTHWYPVPCTCQTYLVYGNAEYYTSYSNRMSTSPSAGPRVILFRWLPYMITPNALRHIQSFRVTFAIQTFPTLKSPGGEIAPHIGRQWFYIIIILACFSFIHHKHAFLVLTIFSWLHSWLCIFIYQWTFLLYDSAFGFSPWPIYAAYLTATKSYTPGHPPVSLCILTTVMFATLYFRASLHEFNDLWNSIPSSQNMQKFFPASRTSFTFRLTAATAPFSVRSVICLCGPPNIVLNIIHWPWNGHHAGIPASCVCTTGIKRSFVYSMSCLSFIWSINYNTNITKNQEPWKRFLKYFYAPTNLCLKFKLVQQMICAMHHRFRRIIEFTDIIDAVHACALIQPDVFRRPRMMLRPHVIMKPAGGETQRLRPFQTICIRKRSVRVDPQEMIVEIWSRIKRVFHSAPRRPRARTERRAGNDKRFRR